MASSKKKNFDKKKHQNSSNQSQKKNKQIHDNSNRPAKIKNPIQDNPEDQNTG